MEPFFIGLGAQKSGTSWIYANLHAHPDVCIPVKEIHFFSREKIFSKGLEWYESVFKRCSKGKKCGEFSTSYLYSEKAVKRIFLYYPEIKLLSVVRNPVDRAFSNFKNDIMAGVVKKGTCFSNALTEHPEYLDQGFYFYQIERYLKKFPKHNLLILIYEDIKKNPIDFMKQIYHFLEVDPCFISPLLYERINPSYVPKNQNFEKLLNKISSRLLRIRGGKIASFLKKTGMHKILRMSNRGTEIDIIELSRSDREKLYLRYADSIKKLEKLLDRKLYQWKT